MPLILAHIDADPRPTFLIGVGKTSEVRTYMPEKEEVTPALPMIDMAVTALSMPANDILD